jgi:hypothetical protein
MMEPYRAKRLDGRSNREHAIVNQLIIYRYLKEVKKWPEDPVLELRLKQQANGTLRLSIEKRFSKPNAQGHGSP